MLPFLVISIITISGCDNTNESTTDEEEEITPDPWDGYNTIKYSKNYKVVYDKEEAFYGHTWILSGGLETWSGLIGFRAERGGHVYPVSDATLSGSCRLQDDKIQYISEGDKIKFQFESSDACTTLLELNLSVNPDTYPDGAPASDLFSVSYGEKEANIKADISDCWVEGTGSWATYSMNNVCEIPLTIGTNTIEILCKGGFNLDSIVVVPSKEYVKNSSARDRFIFDGSELYVEAEKANSTLADCRIEYDLDNYHGEGAISNTTTSTSCEFIIKATKEMDATLTLNAAFKDNGVSQLDERLYFSINSKYYDFFDYDDEGEPIGNPINVIYATSGDWWKTYNSYKLPKSIHLNEGENTIKIEAGTDGFNIDYFTLIEA